MVETLAAPAQEKNIQLHYETVPTPVMIEADKQKLERVITNLTSNAVKYTPEKGDVWLHTFVDGRDAIIEFKDNGYGIPADELPDIFDRYSRVKGHRSIAIGTGLGLAVVKNLVEAHEGTISVTSVVDIGSTFTVRLPIKPGADAQ